MSFFRVKREGGVGSIYDLMEKHKVVRKTKRGREDVKIKDYETT